MKQGWEIKEKITPTQLQNKGAKDLLIKIKEERERLIKEKEITKQKELPVISKDEIPFIIPENWIWVRLVDISIIQEGPGIRKFQYQSEGIQFLTVTNILEGKVDLNKSKKYISINEYNTKYKHFKINKGDIVSSCSGATWGKTAIFNLDDEIILNTSTLRLRFYGDLGENKFLYYLTKSDFFKNQILNQLSGQQPNFGYSHYSVIKVPLPPFSEQKSIVAILEETFTAIIKLKENAEQNLKNAKELFESYLQNVFENKGKDWEEKTLKEVTTKIGSGSTPRGGNESYKAEGISLVRSMNVHDRYFKEKNLAFIDDKQAKELNNVTLQENDVLLNITGASVTRCCIIPKEYLPARVNQHVSIIRPQSKVIDSSFLNLLLTSKFYKDQLIFTGEQGATRQAITKVQLENFVIHYPNLKTQQLIVKKSKELSIETKKLEVIYQNKIADLEELKKSILQKAFSGELKTKKELAV